MTSAAAGGQGEGGKAVVCQALRRLSCQAAAAAAMVQCTTSPLCAAPLLPEPGLLWLQRHGRVWRRADGASRLRRARLPRRPNPPLARRAGMLASGLAQAWCMQACACAAGDGRRSGHPQGEHRVNVRIINTNHSIWPPLAPSGPLAPTQPPTLKPQPLVQLRGGRHRLHSPRCEHIAIVPRCRLEAMPQQRRLRTGATRPG